MRLPVRVRPFADESLSGYAKRVVLANGGYQGHELALLRAGDDAGPSIARIRRWLREQELNRVALFGMTLDLIDERNEHPFAAAHVSAEHARFCPECLREKGYWRAAWEHIFIQHCPRHRVWLTGHCFACYQLIPARRKALLECPCGARLTDAPARRLLSDKTYAEALGSLIGVRHGLFLPLETAGPAYALPPVLEEISTENLLELGLLLGSFLALPNEVKPRKAQLRSDPALCLAVMEEAGRVLFEWPGPFVGWLEQAQAKVQDQPCGPRKAFGQVYRAIYHEFVDGEFRCVRMEFERFMSRRWRGSVMTRRNRMLPNEIKQEQNYVPAKALVGRSQVARAALISRIRQGEIKGRLIEGASGKMRVEVETNDLNRNRAGG